MTKRQMKENTDKHRREIDIMRGRITDLCNQCDFEQRKVKELTATATEAERRRVAMQLELEKQKTAANEAEARCDDLRGTIIHLERQLSRALGYIDRVTESDIPIKRTIEETPPVRGPQRDRFEIEAVRAGLVPDPFATTTHSKTWWRR